MKRKRFYLFMIFTLAALLCRAADVKFVSADGAWNVTVSTDAVTITPTDNTQATYTVPQKVSNAGGTEYAVTAIGANAFKGNTQLTDIDLTQATSLCRIGPSAFEGCTGLTAITLPASLRYIGPIGSMTGASYCSCFKGCTSLRTVTIAAGGYLNTIGEEAFSGCTALTELVLPDVPDGQKLVLCNNMLLNCTGLERVSFPSQTTYTNYGDFMPFTGCTALKEVVFRGENGLLTKSVVFTDQKESLEVLDLRGTAHTSTSNFTGFSKLREVDLASTTTIVGNSSFKNCTSLTTVRLNEGLTTIANEAFRGCTALTSITIPASVKELGGGSKGYIFADCTSLEEVIFTAPSQMEKMYPGTFSGCTSLKEFNFPRGERTGVLDVWGNQFASCPLEKVNISRAVKENPTGGSLIQSANNTLREVTWEDGAVYLGSLYECPNLTRLDMSNTAIDSIGSDKTVVSINYNPNLKEILFPPTLKFICQNAFMFNTALEEVHLPKSIQFIGMGAFHDCTALTTFEIKDGADNTNIDYHFIYNCSNLTTVKLGEGVARMATCSFGGCTSLESIQFPASLSVIQGMQIEGGQPLGMFEAVNGNDVVNCPNLKEVTFAEGNTVSSLPNGFYRGAPGLTSISLPENVITLGGSAVAGFQNLTSITIPNSLKFIGPNFLADCPNVSEVVLPEGTTTINTGFLRNCYSITELRIPANVKSIYAREFLSGCTNLRKLYIDCQPDALITKNADTYFNDDYQRPFATSTSDAIERNFGGDKHFTHLNNCEVYVKDEDVYQDFLNYTSLMRDVLNQEDKEVKLWERLDAESDYNLCGSDNSDYEPESEEDMSDGAMAWHCHNEDFIEADGGYNNRYVYAQRVGMQFSAPSVSATLEGGVSDPLPTVQFTLLQPENQHVTYTSSCPGVATVDEEGNVTVHDGGKAIITAHYAGEAYLYMPDSCSYEVHVAYPESAEVTIGSLGITTYAASYPLDFTNLEEEYGLKAYVVSSYDASTVYMVQVKETCKANTGLVIKGPAGQYTVPVVNVGRQYANLLKAVPYTINLKPTEGDCTNLVLSAPNGTPSFHTTTGGNFGPHKSYLQVFTSVMNATNSANGLQLVFDDDTDGIDTVSTGQDHDVWFNLQGARIAKPTQPGLYIHNGRKEVVK